MNDPRPPLDRIHIRDLRLRCIIGLRPWERLEPQDVNLSLTLFTDLRPAGLSDRLDDTVDYVALKHRVFDLVEASSFFLIERLAQCVADICLECPNVLKVRVVLEKPGALRYARTVSVDITRER
jgi:D-erythro-7,8-dihydroneopterin triphosphate epimerase